MSAKVRMERYLMKQRFLHGRKRVSFFVDEKFWKFVTRRAKKNNMTINEFLQYSFDFN
jgi:predicted DNA-binding ribbon-helix-helix protein